MQRLEQRHRRQKLRFRLQSQILPRRLSAKAIAPTSTSQEDARREQPKQPQRQHPPLHNHHRVHPASHHNLNPEFTLNSPHYDRPWPTQTARHLDRSRVVSSPCAVERPLYSALAVVCSSIQPRYFFFAAFAAGALIGTISGLRSGTSPSPGPGCCCNPRQHLGPDIIDEPLHLPVHLLHALTHLQHNRDPGDVHPQVARQIQDEFQTLQVLIGIEPRIASLREAAATPRAHIGATSAGWISYISATDEIIYAPLVFRLVAIAKPSQNFLP